jgi:microcystin-dependent protein
MADPFLAEIRILATNFAPAGWALCDGQLMPLRQNTALFALIGTAYGGDGRDTFGLPALQGRAPMHPATMNDLGLSGGVETVTLLVHEMPGHTHTVRGSEDDAAFKTPANMLMATGGVMYAGDNPNTTLAFETLAPAGGGLPHNNMQPYLTLLFCIALEGIFPSNG